MKKFMMALDMPWVTVNEIRRIIAIPWYRFLFSILGVPWGKGWCLYGMPMIQRTRGSTIKMGNNVTLRSWRSSNPLSPNHPVILATRTKEARICIGDHVGLTGTTIVAAEHIEIGDYVQVGANSIIVDTDFHPIEPAERQINFLAGKHAPTIIENNVFIGMNSLILKGVRIGYGSTVGAGSVVTNSVPEYSIVVGNPAKVIKKLL